MGENSKIEWTDHTFNPWMGCTKVSPACANCYAERDMDKRLGKVQWGPSGTRVLTSDVNWKKPLKWNEEAGRSFASWQFAVKTCVSEYASVEPYVRPKVFCSSLADVFEDWQGPIVSNGVPVTVADDGTLIRDPDCPFGHRLATMDDVRNRLFELIDATPNLDWLLLTKRPENISRMWPSVFCDHRVCEAAKGSGIYCPHDSCDVDDGVRQSMRHNVWLGTSVENQEQADRRIPQLMDCRELSPVLFLSCEPLLGQVDLTRVEGKIGIGLHSYDVLNGRNYHWDDGGQWTPYDKIDWVIAGGESGPNARPSHPDWFRSLRDQCVAAGVPFHFKQWGEWSPTRNARHSDLSCDATKQVILKPDGQLTAGFLDYGTDAFVMDRIGKKVAGRLLDGLEWNEFPELTHDRNARV